MVRQWGESGDGLLHKGGRWDRPLLVTVFNSWGLAKARSILRMLKLDMAISAAARLDGLGVGARVYVGGGIFMRSLLSTAGLFMRPLRHTAHSRSVLHRRGREGERERESYYFGSIMQETVFQVLIFISRGNWQLLKSHVTETVFVFLNQQIFI